VQERTLWNLVYDVVMRLLRLLGTLAYAYADDILLLIPARFAGDLQGRIKVVIQQLVREFVILGLSLNNGKTEVIIFENLPRWLTRDARWMIKT